MSIRILFSLFTILVLAVVMIYFAAFRPDRVRRSRGIIARIADYGLLVGLFGEWREFLGPKLVDGVPDFSPAAVRDRQLGLLEMKSRLAGIDPSNWPVARKIDYFLLKAEMNGLDFNHRVLRPWSRDPGFYAVFDQFQPTNGGLVSAERLALAEDRVGTLRDQLRAVPRALEAARANLTEPAADLALLAAEFKKKESALLAKLAEDLAPAYPALVPDAEAAREAVDGYRAWLVDKGRGWTAPAGIGTEDFTWLVRNVYALPYDWGGLLTVAKREFERAVTSLKLEEQRDPRRGPLKIRESADYAAFHNEIRIHPLEILRAGKVLFPPDPMAPRPIRSYRPSPARDAFTLARAGFSPRPADFVGLGPEGGLQAKDPLPLRSGPYPPFHIEDIRLEATSAGMEEILMQVGLLDGRARSRELTYNLLAYRAARAVADLRLHAREFTFREALEDVVRSTPNGWVPPDSPVLWNDLDLTLRQPGCGVGCLIGAIQLQQLLADRATQLGAGFNIRKFMDEFLASGIIPISFIRWEMTGLDDQVRGLWEE